MQGLEEAGTQGKQKCFTSSSINKKVDMVLSEKPSNNSNDMILEIYLLILEYNSKDIQNC